MIVHSNLIQETQAEVALCVGTQRLGNRLQRGADFVCVGGADEAGLFLAVFHENQRGPEFDGEGAAQFAAGAVFDGDVLNVGEVFQGFGNCWGGCLAVATPVGAKVEENRGCESVDFFACGVGAVF